MALYILDMGGTLTQSRVGSFPPKAPQSPRDVVLKPGVFERLAGLRAAGHKLAIATNQSAVAEGAMTLKQAESLVTSCIKKVDGVDAWRLSPYNPRAPKKLDGRPNPYARDDPSRKPHPGMILDLMSELGYPPAETFVIGNRPEDRKAAHAAGAFYIPGKEFFREP